MKSEPDVFSIDDLKKKNIASWDGVRNYQARNFMRDQMQLGDLICFYHSSCDIPGIAGIAEVAKLAYPDHTQFDSKSEYYDPKSTKENPRWLMVDVKFVKKFDHIISLEEIKSITALQDMMILRKGNRLSITPISPEEYKIISRLRKDS